MSSFLATHSRQRSSSTASNSSNKNPFRPSPIRTQSNQRDRAARVSHALNNNSPANVASPSSRPGGFSIKGKAGPWTITASNFAPGTTAADIEASLAQDSLDDEGRNGLLSCRLTSTTPTVAAEIVFTERAIADNIISLYNNQLADDRYLRLAYKKQTQPTQKPATPAPAPPTAPAEAPRGPADADVMVMDDDAGPAEPDVQRYEDEREAANRDRRDRESRRDDHEDDRRRDDRDLVRDNRDRDRDRLPRYDDRSYDRRYDDRPRYEAPRGSYGSRGYSGPRGGVRGGYARAAMMSNNSPRGGGNSGGGGGYRDYR
jgi:hypothetical protein